MVEVNTVSTKYSKIQRCLSLHSRFRNYLRPLHSWLLQDAVPSSFRALPPPLAPTPASKVKNCVKKTKALSHRALRDSPVQASNCYQLRVIIWGFARIDHPSCNPLRPKRQNISNVCSEQKIWPWCQWLTESHGITERPIDCREARTLTTLLLTKDKRVKWTRFSPRCFFY